MAAEELRERGALLPEGASEEISLKSPVAPAWYVVLALVAGAAAVLMVLGGGGRWTWYGAILFVASLAGLTGVTWRAVELQNRAVREVARELGGANEGPSGPDA